MESGASFEHNSVSLRPIFFSPGSSKLKKCAKISDFHAPQGYKKQHEIHEIHQLRTFRALETDCDIAVHCFDVRRKVETLAHRLRCIAPRQGTYRRSYGRLNSGTVARNIGVCGGFFVKKMAKIENLPLCRTFGVLKNVFDIFELSLDVRCKVETLAHRLMGIAACYGNYRRSCGHLNSYTVV